MDYPKLVLHGYVHGTRRQGIPKKRWIDTVKDDSEQRDLDIHQATEMTQHRLDDDASIHKRSPILVLTRSDVAQLRRSRTTRYH